MDAIKDTKKGCLVRLYVSPNASRSALKGLYDDRLKLQIAAPPVDGKANAAILRFMAKQLRCSRADLELVRGLSNKRKDLMVQGLNAKQVADLLGVQP